MQSTHYPADFSHHRNYNRNAPLPSLPNIELPVAQPAIYSTFPTSPTTSFDEEEPFYTTRNNRQYHEHQRNRYEKHQDPFLDMDAVPLQPQYTKSAAVAKVTEGVFIHSDESAGSSPGYSRRRAKERFLSWKTPWVVYILTVVQVSVFIAALVKNAILTHSPFEIHPQFNPMIGPSPYVLINMGARYVPCMKNVAGIQNSNLTILWPCPNSTTVYGTCSLSELCGFSGVPNPHAYGSLADHPAPNQWLRFVTPIFLHAGLVHISFNMLLQIVLGREVERAIGHIRFFVVYFSSGIFGFIMGGNFAPGGIASTGASGSLFGVIALTLLDLLYTWRTQKSPVKELLFLVIDILISFALGLLPGLDNFSHIGGFLMGLALGICLLRSPIPMRERGPGRVAALATGPYSKLGLEPDIGLPNQHPQIIQHRKTASADSFSNLFSIRGSRKPKPIWYVWQFFRVGALVGVLVCFVTLLNNFYKYDHQCSWCKYLSCLPIKNWCAIGDLDFTSMNN